MKIAFFGTPDFAVPSLTALVKSKEHKIVCIVAQPDKPQGRGGKVIFGATKNFGLEHSIPVLQPERISNELSILDKYKPDVIVTCAFGQMLKQNVLDYCKHGVINVHASLLPKYRGSSPIQWSIVKGETKTGITIMQTDIGMDTGDIILQMPLDIGDTDTAGDLFAALGSLGGVALIKALSQIEDGTAKRTKQCETGIEATKYPMIEREHARIDWNLSATEINDMVRGFNPWPVAFFTHEKSNQDVKIYKATPMDLLEDDFFKTVRTDKIGKIYIDKNKKQIFVVCLGGILRIDELQIPGGKRISARDFLNGREL